MTRRLPPLNQLRAFEAAARHQSFKDAADELNVTHAAVSHQIKALEGFLGVQLFHRLTREVQLTSEATELANKLTQALDLMAEATISLSGLNTQTPLKISAAPFYGNRLLLPRLDEFTKSHPGVKIDIRLDFGFIDFHETGVDAGVRYGSGNWPNLHCTLLHHYHVTPVCTHVLAASIIRPICDQSFAGVTLATTVDIQTEWDRWFAVAGVTAAKSARFVTFGNRALALDFALAGNGVALTDLHMAEHDLASGHLVCLSPVTLTCDYGMYFVYPETGFPDPRLEVFEMAKG